MRKPKPRSVRWLEPAPTGVCCVCRRRLPFRVSAIEAHRMRDRDPDERLQYEALCCGKWYPVRVRDVIAA